MTYQLPVGYTRQRPASFDDEPTALTWQPDVYLFAFDLARQLDRSVVVDVGCGYGRKLAPYVDEFTVVGIDRPEVIGRVQVHPVALIAADLDSEERLPIDASSLVICSDVVEHMWHPERLLSHLIDTGAPVVLSTPDRDRTHGPGNFRPANECHAQEWTLAELVTLLHDLGAEPDYVGWTRSHDHSPSEATCLVTFGGPL